MSNLILVAIVMVFTAVCAVLDWRTRIIPNWLTVPVFALGLLFHAIVGALSGPQFSFGGLASGLQFSFLGFATGFGLLLVLWLIGGGGGGDVKMMGALGAWLGSWHTIEAFLASAVATIFIGAVAVIGRAVFQSASTTGKSGRGSLMRRGKDDPKRIGRLMPYALPLAVGAWAVLVMAWIGGGLLPY
jgi:prepilin peptidase CpaA